MGKKALIPVNVLASGTTPTGKYAGDLFFKTTENSLYAYDGTNWNPVSGGSLDGGAVDAIFGGVDPTDGGSV
jgi:hypothetical protein